MQLYATFEDKGYAFQAYIPENDDEPVAFEFRILIGDEQKHVLLVPIVHTPVFGVDVDDARFAESVIDRVLAILPPTGQFDATTIAALDALEMELGGKGAREDHAKWRESTKAVGPFEHTGGLFAQRFADSLGSREAMDQWMQTRQPELGDQTPAQALHLGMFQDVLKLLLSTKR
ncbi:MAG: hypothetical protein ACREP2_05035 [Rhodanobacteraceae bacterium]